MTDDDLRALHCEQRLDHSCIAACICMLWRARGVACDEALVFERLSSEQSTRGGYAFEPMRHHLPGRHLRLDALDPSARSFLLHTLRTTWLVAMTFAAPMRYLAQLQCGDEPEPALLGAPGGRHAIVLVDARDSDLRYLDPASPAHRNPCYAPRALFFENVWQGEILVPTLPARANPV